MKNRIAMKPSEEIELLHNTISSTFSTLLAEELEAIKSSQDDEQKSVLAAKIEIVWSGKTPTGLVKLKFLTERSQAFEVDDLVQGKLFGETQEREEEATAKPARKK